MLKPIVFVTLLSIAGSAFAAAGSPPGSMLPLPFYTNGFTSVATVVRNGQTIKTHDASGSYVGPVMVTDPYYTLDVGPTPTPFVIARAHGVGGVNAQGGGTVTYYFAVNGPRAIAVPIGARVVLDAIVGGSAGSVEASSGVVSIFTDLSYASRLVAAEIGGPGAPMPGGRVNELLSVTATADKPGLDSITVTGAASVNEAFGSKGFATLFADPLLTIDPVWAAANPGYTLKFSVGIGNLAGPTGVPEPASWALMVAGFGAVGTVARRRSRRAVA